MDGCGMNRDDAVALAEPGDEVGLLLIGQILPKVRRAVEHEHLISHQVVEVEHSRVVRLINVDSNVPTKVQQPVVRGRKRRVHIPGRLAVN